MPVVGEAPIDKILSSFLVRLGARYYVFRSLSDEDLKTLDATIERVNAHSDTLTELATELGTVSGTADTALSTAQAANITASQALTLANTNKQAIADLMQFSDEKPAESAIASGNFYFYPSEGATVGGSSSGSTTINADIVQADSQPDASSVAEGMFVVYPATDLLG